MHEANNLLQAIAAEARLLADRAPSDGDRRRLERIVEQAMSLGDVLARLSPDAPSSPRERLMPVEAIVERALGLVEARARRAEVALERDVSVGLLVRACGSQLEHALVNLLVNAIQALELSDLEGPRRRVRVTARPGAPGRVRLTVRDEGPGVPGAVRDLLLRAPVTTKARGQGSGQGLLLVRRLVEAHGGGVTLASTAGACTEVTLDLPAVAHDGR